MKINRDFCEGEYVKPISLEDFQDSGMLWYVNSLLHQFGLALVYDTEKKNLYPAICRFRGFSEEANDKGYKKVTEYLRDNVTDLLTDFEV